MLFIFQFFFQSDIGVAFSPIGLICRSVVYMVTSVFILKYMLPSKLLNGHHVTIAIYLVNCIHVTAL